MTDYNLIKSIAEDFGLGLEETTTSANGYPSNLMLVITDFNSITQCIEVAEQLNSRGFDIEFVELHKRDGWSIWHRYRIPTPSIGMYTAISERDWFIEYDPINDNPNDVAFRVIAEGRDIEDYDTLQLMAELVADFANELDEINEPSTVFYNPDNRYRVEIVTTEQATGYYYDTRHFKIGIKIDD